MRPLRDYGNDLERSEELGWGEHAVFSEHPSDDRNRPQKLGTPLFRRGVLSYRMLTPRLQQLTERALIEGLCSPDDRPSAREWRDALAWAIDELWYCPLCRHHFPFPIQESPRNRKCPFCGKAVSGRPPVRLDFYERRSGTTYTPTQRHVLLGEGFGIYPDVLQSRLPPLRRSGMQPVGTIEWDAAGGSYRLRNESSETWTESMPDDSERSEARSGESLAIREGSHISFGQDRLARVQVAL
jgi:hypothetical protein